MTENIDIEVIGQIDKRDQSQLVEAMDQLTDLSKEFASFRGNVPHHSVLVRANGVAFGDYSHTYLVRVDPSLVMGEAVIFMLTADGEVGVGDSTLHAHAYFVLNSNRENEYAS